MPMRRRLETQWDRVFYGIIIRLQSLKVYRALVSRCHPSFIVVEATAQDMHAVRAWLGTPDQDMPAASPLHARKYVAKSLGKIIGFVEFVRYDDTKGALTGYWGSSLRVRIGWRGMGVGEALGRRGRADARAAGATMTSLTVYADNLPAVGLYRKQGYERRSVPELDEQFQREASAPGHYRIVMSRLL